MKGSVSNIIRNPFTFLSVGTDLLFRRSIAFFFCYNFGFFDPVYMLNPAKIPNRYASNLEFYLFLSVFTGFLLVMRNKEIRKRAWPMLLLLFYYTLMHVVVARMGNIRYRAPIHPYLIIFGATAITLLIDYIKKGLNSYNENTINKS